MREITVRILPFSALHVQKKEKKKAEEKDSAIWAHIPLLWEAGFKSEAFKTERDALSARPSVCKWRGKLRLREVPGINSGCAGPKGPLQGPPVRFLHPVCVCVCVCVFKCPLQQALESDAGLCSNHTAHIEGSA